MNNQLGIAHTNLSANLVTRAKTALAQAFAPNFAVAVA